VDPQDQVDAVAAHRLAERLAERRRFAASTCPAL
jgi:hypothetical protein